MEESSTSEIVSEPLMPETNTIEPPSESPLVELKRKAGRPKKIQVQNGGRGPGKVNVGRIGFNTIDKAPKIIPRSPTAVGIILRSWKPAREQAAERIELLTVWNWMEEKAKQEDKSLHTMPVNPAGVRLTILYMMNVLDEVEIEVKELRRQAQASLADYLTWDISEMAAFTHRQESLKVDARMRSHFALVEKELVKSIKAGSQVAIQNWMKATGNYMGEKSEEDAFRVIKFVDKYEEKPLPEIPTESIKGLPVESRST